MKTCAICQQSKEDNEFYRHKGTLDGLRSECKECGRAEARRYYKNNPTGYKKRAQEAKHKIRDDRAEWFDQIRLKYGCRVCHEHTLAVLDFHHLDPNAKEFCVTNQRDKGLKKLIDEINKCVILCANCHRRVHANLIQIDSNLLCKEVMPTRKDGKERHLLETKGSSPA